jgi:MOSC domain-containing protein YiiM
VPADTPGRGGAAQPDPPGHDPRPAVIVAGLRNPCAQINGFRPGLLRCVLGRDEAGDPVRKAGVMGVVLRGGRVVPGDPVTVDLPPGPHVPLERV